MRPFDIDQAKAGKPVCTRDGRKVQILKFDVKHEDYPIIGISKYDDGSEDAISWTLNGRCFLHADSDSDIFMASEKREGWVNVYECPTDPSRRDTGHNIYNTKEEAEKHKAAFYITTVKIEWEE